MKLSEINLTEEMDERQFQLEMMSLLLKKKVPSHWRHCRVKHDKKEGCILVRVNVELDALVQYAEAQDAFYISYWFKADKKLQTKKLSFEEVLPRLLLDVEKVNRIFASEAQSEPDSERLLEILSREDLISMLRQKLTKDGYLVTPNSTPWVDVVGWSQRARIFVDSQDEGTWALNLYRNRDDKKTTTKFNLPLEKVLALVKPLKVQS